MTNPAQFDLLLNSIEENCPPAEYEQALLPFMFDCADLIEPRLPQVARESLSIAKSFAQGHLDMEALEHAVISSWKAIGDGPQGLQVDNPQVAGIRAVICILHRELHSENKYIHPECGELVDSISFYLQLLNNVEPCFQRQDVLIKKWFGACL